MTLSDHANKQGRQLPTNEELEGDMRFDLAPLIEFLKRAAAFDDGYPDAYPEDKRSAEEETGQTEYREDGLNNEYIGCTLEHLINFSETGESHDARKGHGRYLEVAAWIKDHRIYGTDESRLFSVSLFEDGKKHVGLDAYTSGIDQEFSRERDNTSAMRDIIAEYTIESARVDGNIDAALARGQGLIKIANDVRAEYLKPDNQLVMSFDGNRIHTGIEPIADTADHTAE